MRCVYVITPSFNAFNTIDETLYNVFNQQGDYKIRYHVQDGMSRDGTQKKLEKFAQKIKNCVSKDTFEFSWVSRPDNGMYHAISLAVEHLDIPEEDFMGWINSDDLLYNGCITHLFMAADLLPRAQWFGGLPLSTDMNGNIISKKGFNWYGQQLIKNGLCDGIHWQYIQQEGTFWQKRLWDAVGGINPNLRLAGDWDLWRRMATHAPYIQLPWHMGIFRKHPGQLSSNLAAYNEEIDTICPMAARCRRLRSLSIKPAKFFAPTVIPIGDNQFKLADIPLSTILTCKMRIRFFLLSMGLHPIVTICQRILRLFKACEK